ncbi:MAG: hypothetical protein E6I91_02180 [Chloroflexi bacterium]|nr:MAG: hypothetical protein E6I91_02180 [Chloroflexota bacterium]
MQLYWFQACGVSDDFPQHHSDTGTCMEGRSIGRVRDKSAPTGGWMMLWKVIIGHCGAANMSIEAK